MLRIVQVAKKVRALHGPGIGIGAATIDHKAWFALTGWPATWPWDT